MARRRKGYVMNQPPRYQVASFTADNGIIGQYSRRSIDAMGKRRP